MAYLRFQPEAALGSFGCGHDCRCSACRQADSCLAGLGCGRDCRCAQCRGTLAGFGERYVSDDDDDDSPRQPRARTTLPPTRMRSGLGAAGFGGLGVAPAPRVVLVPGIMGSRLVERTTGLPIWGDPRMIAAVLSPVRARCGDGTVPGSSAMLRAASNITPLFRTSTLEHGDLFNDAAIRALCLSLVRGAAMAPIPGPACAGPAPRTGLEGGYGCAAHEAAATMAEAEASF